MANKMIHASQYEHWGDYLKFEKYALGRLISGDKFIQGFVTAGITDDHGNSVNSILLCTPTYGVCVPEDKYYLGKVPESPVVQKCLEPFMTGDVVEAYWHIGVSEEKDVQPESYKGGKLVKGKAVHLVELVDVEDQHAAWINEQIFTQFFPRADIYGVTQQKFLVSRGPHRVQAVYICHEITFHNYILDGLLMPYLTSKDYENDD